MWNMLADVHTLYDEWLLRKTFFNPHTHSMIAYIDSLDSPSALLALQVHRDSGQLSFIGAPFLERNRGFCKPGQESNLISLYSALPDTVSLDDISSLDPICATEHCTPSDAAYYIDRNTLNYTDKSSLYLFLPRNLRENIRKIEKKFVPGRLHNEPDDLSSTVDKIRTLMFDRFGSDSWLEEPHIYQAILDLEKIADQSRLKCVSNCMYDGDRFIGGCVSVIHANTLYMLAASVSHDNQYSGLGTYLHYYNMIQAFEAGCERIDTGIGDCGWKDRWGLSQFPQSVYRSPKMDHPNN